MGGEFGSGEDPVLSALLEVVVDMRSCRCQGLYTTVMYNCVCTAAKIKSGINNTRSGSFAIMTICVNSYV